jgi:hypothetical protein
MLAIAADDDNHDTTEAYFAVLNRVSAPFTLQFYSPRIEITISNKINVIYEIMSTNDRTTVIWRKSFMCRRSIAELTMPLQQKTLRSGSTTVAHWQDRIMHLSAWHSGGTAQLEPIKRPTVVPLMLASSSREWKPD